MFANPISSVSQSVSQLFDSRKSSYAMLDLHILFIEIHVQALKLNFLHVKNKRKTHGDNVCKPYQSVSQLFDSRKSSCALLDLHILFIEIHVSALKLHVLHVKNKRKTWIRNLKSRFGCEIACSKRSGNTMLSSKKLCFP